MSEVRAEGNDLLEEKVQRLEESLLRITIHLGLTELGDAVTADSDAVLKHQTQKSEKNVGTRWGLRVIRNARLSHQDQRVTKTSGSRAAWECHVVGTHGWVSGTHFWHVRLESQGPMMIGVAPVSASTASSHWSSVGFHLGTSSGCLFGQDGTWKKDCLGTSCMGKGTIISVKLQLDLTNCKIWFGVKGEFRTEPAWTLPPVTSPLFPSFYLDDKGSSFSVIETLTTTGYE